jgi:hypothetical protein
MVELLQRSQQVTGATREAVELPDQHTVDFMLPGSCHQGVELGAALPTA